MRIAIAHEWLVTYAGSERCVAEMLEVYPGSEVVTTLVKPSALPESLRAARPSLLQRLPRATEHHEWLLPAMPAAWRLRPRLGELDAVVSSSHACAKAVRVQAGTPHLCYCHTPMRYAWDFDLERERFPRGLRGVAGAAMGGFRTWDRGTSRGVTRFVANSRAVAERIERCYGRTAEVIHPPVRTDYFTPNGAAGDGPFLFVGRLVSYKRADLVVEAFADLPYELVVIGGGQQGEALRERATPNVTFLGSVDDEELRRRYRQARALVYPAMEDFGIVMAEAQACGTPVIGFADGGAPDIVEDGVTGWLVDEQTPAAIRRAVRLAASTDLDRAAISARAERFSAERFRESFRAAVEDMVRHPAPR